MVGETADDKQHGKGSLLIHGTHLHLFKLQSHDGLSTCVVRDRTAIYCNSGLMTDSAPRGP